MGTIAEILRTTAKNFVSAGPELSIALGTLGPDAHRAPADVPPARRLALADQFVRNLRSLPQDRAVDLERTLFPILGADFESGWTSDIGGSQSVIAVRKQLRLMLVSAGLPFAAVARLQACVCMLVDWIGSAGGGSIEMKRIPRGVHVKLTTSALGGDAGLLAESPMVGALRQHSSDIGAERQGAQILLQFTLTDGSR
ncbi:MAG TPA: hypothetical protein VLW85_17580 [Myxococcales bacterium]|nr:hypothetical protein [Myxococcales bacterium]